MVLKSQLSAHTSEPMQTPCPLLSSSTHPCSTRLAPELGVHFQSKDVLCSGNPCFGPLGQYFFNLEQVIANRISTNK
jgi:hypothetical protein